MTFTILTIGKSKERWWNEASAEYIKRLKRYANIELYEFADEKTPENASPSEEEQIRKKEGERVLKFLDHYKGYLIALAIEGKKMDSPGLSAYLDRLMTEGQSRIAFLIGGSLGLSEELLKRADALLSFSDMTFPHQMMKVILLEQLYRSRRISCGEPYHK